MLRGWSPFLSALLSKTIVLLESESHPVLSDSETSINSLSLDLTTYAFLPAPSVNQEGLIVPWDSQAVGGSEEFTCYLLITPVCLGNCSHVLATVLQSLLGLISPASL